MKVYISGPITGHEKTYFDEFKTLEKSLIESGAEVINPCTLPHNHGHTYEDFMKEDLIAMLTYCDKIIMMQGWETSKGALDEKRIAEICGFEVLYVS